MNSKEKNYTRPADLKTERPPQSFIGAAESKRSSFRLVARSNPEEAFICFPEAKPLVVFFRCIGGLSVFEGALSKTAEVRIVQFIIGAQSSGYG
jgi:hypothetical protein